MLQPYIEGILHCESLLFQVFPRLSEEFIVSCLHVSCEAMVREENGVLVFVHQHVPLVYLRDPIFHLLYDIVEVLLDEAHHFRARH